MYSAGHDWKKQTKRICRKIDLEKMLAYVNGKLYFFFHWVRIKNLSIVIRGTSMNKKRKNESDFYFIKLHCDR